jgi:hypothetical protein
MQECRFVYDIGQSRKLEGTATFRFLWEALDLNTELRDILHGGNLVLILLIVVSEIHSLS